MTKGKSLRSSHLLVTGRASILILILINITITGVTIIVLLLKCLWRRRGKRYETTKVILSLCNTTNMGVHLIQLSSECRVVEAFLPILTLILTNYEKGVITLVNICIYLLFPLLLWDNKNSIIPIYNCTIYIMEYL